ncbi:CDP-glycerol glycerophosphotransferase family protein [Carboxylicivirga caseinilyticus]|uniref:CDP-glycerol glycerophosphotransferase family protein n=1 Tax=Carboxylicivirga caseinilyticus TaxID=3417572 RepID=UPI003D347880|nr:CDP-glycerol glycerophosphotransferase family protein [Marinilabiliaceae bacterium A049]
MIKKIIWVIIGLSLKFISHIFPVNRNKWVFGANDGNSYADNAKYFFEYTYEEHKDINCIWLTRNREVRELLRSKGLNVYMNFSLVGIYHALTAGVVLFCTMRSDILFIYPREQRRIINLWHGMPMKKIVHDYEPHSVLQQSYRAKLWDWLVVGFGHHNVDLIPATSECFATILKSAFRNENVEILGQPRTDVFFKWDAKEIKKNLGFMEDDIVITYMPTHRAYGKGLQNPKIFKGDSKAIDFFKKNNIKIIWKFHKNMVLNYREDKEGELSEVFIDMTKEKVDPQELLFVSDILITDYSSCYIDYMLLNRPIVFYLYDDYETNDNELYFSPQEIKGAYLAFNESELLTVLEKSLTESNGNIEVSSFHLHNDNNSCKRIFEFLQKQC